MSEQQLRSYRLTSLEEPTDEMLHAIMEKVAIAARKSSEHVLEIHRMRLAEIAAKNTSRYELSMAKSSNNTLLTSPNGHQC